MSLLYAYYEGNKRKPGFWGCLIIMLVFTPFFGYFIIESFSQKKAKGCIWCGNKYNEADYCGLCGKNENGEIRQGFDKKDNRSKSIAMRNLFIFLFLFPVITSAQNNETRFNNDTLYTSSGYKIFSGQTLEFGTGTMRDGRFRYLTVKNGILSKPLTGRKFIVKKITGSSTTVLDNNYVDFTGYLIMKDNSREYVVIHMAYDFAIENSPALPSEIKVPNEFKNKRKRNIKKELVTARNLYEDKVITKTAYKELKQKITSQ